MQGRTMMQRRGTNRTDRGFTLVEVMLAIAISGTVMLTVGTTFHAMLDAREAIEELSESTEAGPRILNLLERDLQGMWTFNVHDNAVFRGRDMDVGSFEADRMDFLTTTDSVGYVLDSYGNPKRTSLCEVGYWFKPNQRYRDLIEMYRREDPLVDRDLIQQGDQGTFQLVHDRIKSFKVTYFDELGYEAEEQLEWDSSKNDLLPRRIRVEFTIERRRGSRNVVNDAEIDDFESAEKTYIRHFVFDPDQARILRGGQAMVPVLPPGAPTGMAGEQPGGAPGLGGGGGPGGPGGPGGQGNIEITQGRATTQRGGPGGDGIRAGGDGGRGAGRGGFPGGGNRPSTTTNLPPGFNINQILGGAGGAGGFGGFGGFGGLGGR